jgi:mono/diheme cytochrome c family protein
VRGRGREAVRAALAGLLAAAAVLLALGGPVRGGEDGDGARASADTGAATRLDGPAAGRALFARMSCGSCHMLARGAGIGPIGPNLDTVLPNYDAAMLRAKIVDPYPAGPSPSHAQMPRDYGSRMTSEELDDLVAFLLATARG